MDVAATRTLAHAEGASVHRGRAEQGIAVAFEVDHYDPIAVGTKATLCAYHALRIGFGEAKS